MTTRLLFCSFLFAVHVFADGPADNVADKVRRQPPAGVAIPDEARKSLTDEAARLGAAIEAAKAELKGKPVLTFLPDVQIFHKAVDWALRYDEFFNLKQTEWAAQQLKDGFTRLEALKKGETPWLAQTGLVPRGYVSKIDGSVQPFGLVVPASFNANLPWEWNLNCWFHGRGETLTELDFIHQRQTSPGEFTPRDTIVLHPYGRYCNGQRFAGETDFFEALETVKRDYRIDEDRIAVRGFSLGGAACWHIATHHAWQWCAANPGAGFSETEQFLNFFQNEKLKPYSWERKLWNLYDSTAVAGNLFNCPTVAYSGEKDRQKQAADLMAIAMKKEGMELTHIIGPNTAHSYEKGAKAQVQKSIDRLAWLGKVSIDANLRFQTFSLRTNKAGWIRLDGLEDHWRKADLTAHNGTDITVTTTNVSAFTIKAGPGEGTDIALRDEGSTVIIDEQKLDVKKTTASDRSWEVSFRKKDGRWEEGTLEGLRKKHGLQGPIDDAFMDSFIFVRPTGTAANEKAGAWAKAEMERAIEHWRRHFRGDSRVKNDAEVTDEDIKSANLVLWGDPSSNSVMAKVAPKIPVSWSSTEIKAGTKAFPAADHALICIYPNPLNPERYVVFNSSFTFREYDYLNNARQTPKLPDWAIIELNTPPGSRYPGGIPLADFFGEKWELKTAN
ncbi:MAG TPA: prolyl oligopeptidase family serine peptidase [Verrucomicrobiales bacterium]|nr:prolyl oligopeptidase family serine peptidase [Verrucomicrobiales bacterium]